MFDALLAIGLLIVAFGGITVIFLIGFRLVFGSEPKDD